MITAELVSCGPGQTLQHLGQVDIFPRIALHDQGGGDG